MKISKDTNKQILADKDNLSIHQISKKYNLQLFDKIDLADYTSKRVGIIELHRGKFDEAIKYLTQSYNENPNDPLVLYNLSLGYSKKEDFKTALNFINECLIVNPKYPEANNLKQEILNQSESE